MNQIIENIIKQFDFEKVHKAMVATDWRWFRTNDVPTVHELTATAIYLLKRASEMEVGTSVSSGGFAATKLYDEEHGEGLMLEFILTETDSYEREEQ